MELSKINKELLCGVLHQYLKNLHSRYLDNIKRDFPNRKANSKYLKETQKVLEYLRKGHKYNIDIKEMVYLPVDDSLIRIKVIGRNTWKKIENYEFDIAISDNEFTNCSKIVNRKLKLESLIG